jgi:hypothetical protein
MEHLSEFDWNFDRVPDKELVACCYWEYARESAFIRDVRQRCRTEQQPGGPAKMRLHEDLQKVQSIGYPSEVFLRGFFCPQDGVLPDAIPLAPGDVHRLTGSFPNPWQKLTKTERTYRARIGNAVERAQLVPFKRGIFVDAKGIVDWVEEQRSIRDAANERARRENPEKTEAALVREGKLCFPEILPSQCWESGRESAVVTINWALFTNDEITNYFRRWVKANRPKDLPAPSGRGHKLSDWRAQLTCLAVMRLLAQATVSEILTEAKKQFVSVWKTEQFSGRKWLDTTKWYDARRQCGRIFHRLFPFLTQTEKPTSWHRQPPAK